MAAKSALSMTTKSAAATAASPRMPVLQLNNLDQKVVRGVCTIKKDRGNGGSGSARRVCTVNLKS
jgi:hypothetical protein